MYLYNMWIINLETVYEMGPRTPCAKDRRINYIYAIMNKIWENFL